MVVEGAETFPLEETLAPTVVESHVPERTQRRGELRRASVREEDNGFFFVSSPRRNQERAKPEFLRGGYRVFSPYGGGKRGIGPSSFFFVFRFCSFFSP